MTVITALLAFLLGFFSATYFAMRQADIAAINDHLEDIKKIEELSVSYWLDEVDSEKEKSDLGHKLRGKLHATAVFRSRSAKVIGWRFEEYADIDDELFDAATGGDFESIYCKPSPETAIRVMKTCNQMRALLRDVRRHIYWAH